MCKLLRTGRGNLYKKVLILGLATLGAALTSQAGLIGLWTFDTAPGTGPFLDNANPTTNPARSSFYDNSAQITTSIAVGSTGGTTVTDPRTSQSASSALTLDSGGAITIQITHGSLTGFTLTYAAQKTGGSPTQGGWSWSTTVNGTYSTVGVNNGSLPLGSGSSWAINTVTFGTLDPSTTIFLRETISSGGTVAFDNIQVSAVPEPINYALGAFAFCIVVVGVGRLAYTWVRA